MAPCVQFERDLHQLRFEEFPIAPVVYQEEDPKDEDSFLRLEVADAQTKQIEAIFLRTIDLRRIGISVTVLKDISNDPQQVSELLQGASYIEGVLRRAVPVVSQHVAPQYVPFFKDRASQTNREICRAICQKIEHISGMRGVPGMYFSHFEPFPNIFINLKKTRPLGQGTFGKVRTVLWLNAPRKSPCIVAKKGLRRDRLDYRSTFETEIAALRRFSEKRGIISLISGGDFNGKYALFLPLYECTLWQCLQQPQFPIFLNEILNVASQWLDGLATISEQGIHGDLHPKNLLLRNSAKGIEAVIADFGTYRSYGEAEYGLTTPVVAPPEYYAEKQVTSKHDVWAMGISLLEMCSKDWLPCWSLKTEQKMEQWTSELIPGWSLKSWIHVDTPPFLVHLINEMLDPCADDRPTPKEAFDRFSLLYPGT